MNQNLVDPVNVWDEFKGALGSGAITQIGAPFDGVKLTDLLAKGGVSTRGYTTLLNERRRQDEVRLRAKHRNLSAILAMVLALCIPASGSSTTINNNLADPRVFDPTFYLYSNPDFKTAKPPILTTDQATQHWLTYGIKEGRRSRNDFSVLDYLALNPDVSRTVARYGPAKNVAAVQYYLNAGFHEGRQTIKPNSRYTYTDGNGNVHFGNEIVQFLSNVQESAGAISSMKVWNFETVNRSAISADGRLMQIAVFLNNAKGGCENPTEAGSFDEPGQFKPNSSSILNLLATSPGELETQVNAANWYYSSSPYYAVAKVNIDCSNLPNYADSAPYPADSPQSGVMIGKYIKVGVFDNPALISWQSTITMPHDFWGMTVEAPTGHQVRAFNTYQYIDLRDSQLDLKPLTPVNGLDEAGTAMWMNNFFPIILSTADGASAVGVISFDFTPSSYVSAVSRAKQAELVPARYFGYTWWPVGDYGHDPLAIPTSKWDTSFSQGAGSAGKYTYMSVMAVGTRKSVYNNLVSLVKNQMVGNFAEVIAGPNGKVAFDPAYYNNANAQFAAQQNGHSVFGSYTPSTVMPTDMSFDFDLADLTIYGGADHGRSSSKGFSPLSYINSYPEVASRCGHHGYYCAMMDWVTRNHRTVEGGSGDNGGNR